MKVQRVSSEYECDVPGVIKKYGECLNEKMYYSKRHIAINPPQNTPPRFEHTYLVVFATF